MTIGVVSIACLPHGEYCGSLEHHGHVLIMTRITVSKHERLKQSVGKVLTAMGLASRTKGGLQAQQLGDSQKLAFGLLLDVGQPSKE